MMISSPETAVLLNQIALVTGEALDARPWLRRSRAEQAMNSLYPLLPVFACRAVGGDQEQAISLAAAWSMNMTAAELLDMVQDGDLALRRPELSAGEAIGLAAGLLFTGQQMLLSLTTLDVDPQVVLAVAHEMAEAGLMACEGQRADLQARSHDPTVAEVLAVAGGKSGPVFGVGAWAGGRLGTDDPALLAALHAFGQQVGIIAQLVNDWYGLWCTGPAPDLLAGKLTLPLLYALEVAEERRPQLEALLGRAQEPAAHEAVRQWLRELGTLEYMATLALLHRERAEQAVAVLPSAGRLLLSRWLAQVADPLVPAAA